MENKNFYLFAAFKGICYLCSDYCVIVYHGKTKIAYT